MIRAASRPAFAAPLIAIVATGMPAGICTIDSSESRPSRRASCTGTPITGSVVIDATMPGRCAAPPAPAITTRMPRSAAPRANRDILSGVRCADTTSASNGMPSSARMSAAARIVGQSESDPMMIETSGWTGASVSVTRRA